jgi:hypothetical protein
MRKPSASIPGVDREYEDEELDGECSAADLRPGVMVSDATFDDSTPGAFEEVSLVGVE